MREEFPDAVIVRSVTPQPEHVIKEERNRKWTPLLLLRPATTFGPEDRFLNWIAETADRLPFMPILNEGKTLVQPVHAGDVGKALMAIVNKMDKFKGKTFQLYGPAEYSFKEVYEFVTDITTKKKTMIDVPLPVAQFAGRFLGEVTCHNLIRTCHNLTRTCHNLTRTCHNLTRTCHNLTRTCHNLTRICHNSTLS